MQDVSLEKLVETGAHFGHQVRRWNPRMKPYLYGEEGGVHIFDLIKTKKCLDEALEVLQKASKEGKKILIVGTKKQAKEKVKEIAIEAGVFYVNERWLGGTLTNFDQLRLSTQKMTDMEKKYADGYYNKYKKKKGAVREAANKAVETVGLIDSNSDPDVVDWPIPMNDDATKAIEYVLDLFKEAIMEGRGIKSSTSETGSTGEKSVTSVKKS